jgi:hypothetical protein
VAIGQNFTLDLPTRLAVNPTDPIVKKEQNGLKDLEEGG